MTAGEPGSPVRVSAGISYSPVPATAMMRLGVALTDWSLPRVEDIKTRATRSFAAGAPFLVQVTVFDGEPHPHRWAGHEIHSRHALIRTRTLNVLAVAQNALEVPRHAAQALPGLEDWADQPPWSVLGERAAAVNAVDGCVMGLWTEGWQVWAITPSEGTFELSAPVVRLRTDPMAQAPDELGTVTVSITLD